MDEISNHVSAQSPLAHHFVLYQEFKLTGAGNESLVLLTDLEYKKLEEMTGVQPCSATLPPQYRGGGRITEYHKGHARICWLSQTDACQYLTAIHLT